LKKMSGHWTGGGRKKESAERKREAERDVEQQVRNERPDERTRTMSAQDVEGL
jgi:hypothetical protein